MNPLFGLGLSFGLDLGQASTDPEVSGAGRATLLPPATEVTPQPDFQKVLDAARGQLPAERERPTPTANAASMVSNPSVLGQVSPPAASGAAHAFVRVSQPVATDPLSPRTNVSDATWTPQNSIPPQAPAPEFAPHLASRVGPPPPPTDGTMNEGSTRPAVEGLIPAVDPAKIVMVAATTSEPAELAAMPRWPNEAPTLEVAAAPHTDARPTLVRIEDGLDLSRVDTTELIAGSVPWSPAAMRDPGPTVAAAAVDPTETPVSEGSTLVDSPVPTIPASRPAPRTADLSARGDISVEAPQAPHVTPAPLPPTNVPEVEAASGPQISTTPRGMPTPSADLPEPASSATQPQPLPSLAYTSAPPPPLSRSIEPNLAPAPPTLAPSLSSDPPSHAPTDHEPRNERGPGPISRLGPRPPLPTPTAARDDASPASVDPSSTKRRVATAVTIDPSTTSAAGDRNAHDAPLPPREPTRGVRPAAQKPDQNPAQDPAQVLFHLDAAPLPGEVPPADTGPATTPAVALPRLAGAPVHGPTVAASTSDGPIVAVPTVDIHTVEPHTVEPQTVDPRTVDTRTVPRETASTQIAAPPPFTGRNFEAPAATTLSAGAQPHAPALAPDSPSARPLSSAPPSASDVPATPRRPSSFTRPMPAPRPRHPLDATKMRAVDPGAPRAAAGDTVQTSQVTVPETAMPPMVPPHVAKPNEAHARPARVQASDRQVPAPDPRETVKAADGSTEHDGSNAQEHETRADTRATHPQGDRAASPEEDAPAPSTHTTLGDPFAFESDSTVPATSAPLDRSAAPPVEASVAPAAPASATFDTTPHAEVEASAPLVDLESRYESIEGLRDQIVRTVDRLRPIPEGGASLRFEADGLGELELKIRRNDDGGYEIELRASETEAIDRLNRERDAIERGLVRDAGLDAKSVRIEVAPAHRAQDDDASPHDSPTREQRQDFGQQAATDHGPGQRHARSQTGGSNFGDDTEVGPDRPSPTGEENPTRATPRTDALVDAVA